MFAWRKRAPKDHPAGDPAQAERFLHGTRGIADLVAPAAVEVGRSHLRLDSQYVRTLVVVGYPRTVSPGWLSPLIDFEAPLEISLHVYPLESAAMIRALSHKLVQLHSSRLLAARGGRLADPEREVAYEDAERLRDALQRGEERVFSVSLYILLRAGSLGALDHLTRQVETVLDGLLAHSRVAMLEQDLGFRACLPQADDALRVYRNLDTGSLATLFPFASSSLTMGQGVLLGIARHNHSPVIVDPFEDSLENANLVIFAKSGAGKSYFTKLVLVRSLLRDVDCLVIDPEDEYARVCQAVGGQMVRLSASSRHRLNPFDLPPVDLVNGARNGLAEQVASVLSLLDLMLAERGRTLSVGERATLDHAVYATYAQAGITADPATHSQPAPLLRDLHRVLADLADAEGRSLAARLRRYVDGSLAGLFDGPTNVALDRHLTVFNVQALEAELRPLAIHLITGFVWRQARRDRRPRLLVVDEAWSLMQYPEGGAFLASMARRARKYYLGLVTITQDVADFLGAEHGRTVLSNAALKLLMKQDSTTVDPVVAAFDLSPEERQFLLGAAKGEGLFFARGRHVALQVEASPQEHRLVTTAPRELTDGETARREGTPAAATITPRRHASPTLPDVPDVEPSWQMDLLGQSYSATREEARHVHRP